MSAAFLALLTAGRPKQNGWLQNTLIYMTLMFNGSLPCVFSLSKTGYLILITCHGRVTATTRRNAHDTSMHAVQRAVSDGVQATRVSWVHREVTRIHFLGPNYCLCVHLQ